MRRNPSFPRAGHAAVLDRMFAGELTHTARSRRSLSVQASKGRMLNLDKWKPDSEDSVDDILSSALVAQDKELARILQEVEKLSKALKSGVPHTQTLTHTLQRTLMCAAKQSLLDRELRSLALTDDLTCLYNRRAFLALAGQQLRVARRKAQGLLLFFADVNNLKEINDIYGHREGDLALVRTADALERTFRNSDVIARLAGDEFAILALEAACENRDVILHRLEKSLHAASSDESRYKLSLSVGMARFDPRRPVPLGKLISLADEAMYEQKKRR
jgi:two-component system cell cycle response regulator